MEKTVSQSDCIRYFLINISCITQANVIFNKIDEVKPRKNRCLCKNVTSLVINIKTLNLTATMRIKIIVPGSVGNSKRVYDFAICSLIPLVFQCVLQKCTVKVKCL